MSNFKSNLRSCAREAALPVTVFAAMIAMIAFAALSLMFFHVMLGINVIVSVLLMLSSMAVLMVFFCAAWKTWGRHWFSRENE